MEPEVGLLKRAVPAVAKRPDLWLTAIAQAFRLAPTGWWRRKPFLPLPDDDYLRFRLQTQYGNPAHQPEPHDLVTYLEWCKGYRKVAR